MRTRNKLYCPKRAIRFNRHARHRRWVIERFDAMRCTGLSIRRNPARYSEQCDFPRTTSEETASLTKGVLYKSVRNSS